MMNQADSQACSKCNRSALAAWKEAVGLKQAGAHRWQGSWLTQMIVAARAVLPVKWGWKSVSIWQTTCHWSVCFSCNAWVRCMCTSHSYWCLKVSLQAQLPCPSPNLWSVHSLCPLWRCNGHSRARSYSSNIWKHMSRDVLWMPCSFGIMGV